MYAANYYARFMFTRLHVQIEIGKNDPVFAMRKTLGADH